MQITCESFLQQIVPFLEGELSKSQNETMATHVESCPTCAELSAGLDNIHLSPEEDLIGKQVRQKELLPDFWTDMSAVLESELDKNFESQPQLDLSNGMEQSSNSNASIFLLASDQKLEQSNVSVDKIKSKEKPHLELTSIDIPSTLKSDAPRSFVQSRRKNDFQNPAFHFREMLLAALCLVFLLWGYRQQQQNVTLEHKIQMQNIEIQHLRISIEKRPNSPRTFQDPYAIPANYVPNRLDL
jgi:hypothetical protein